MKVLHADTSVAVSKKPRSFSCSEYEICVAGRDVFTIADVTGTEQSSRWAAPPPPPKNNLAVSSNCHWFTAVQMLAFSDLVGPGKQYILPILCLLTGRFCDVLVFADLFCFESHLVEAFCVFVIVMLPMCTWLFHHTSTCS